jgi:hypothetical protein
MKDRSLLYIIFVLVVALVVYNFSANKGIAYGNSAAKTVYGFAIPDLPDNFIVIDGETKNIYHYQINFSQGQPRFILRNVTNMTQDYRYFLRGK